MTDTVLVAGPETLKSLPVPVKVTVCVAGAASSANVSVAVRVPAPCGVNVIFTTQLAEVATGVAVAQVVPPPIVKSDAFVPLIAGATEKCSDA